MKILKEMIEKVTITYEKGEEEKVEDYLLRNKYIIVSTYNMKESQRKGIIGEKVISETK